MSHISSLRLAILPLVTVGLIVLSQADADAQRRRPVVRAPAGRAVVHVRVYGYPRYRSYGPWFQYGYPWGPWGPFPPYRYGYPVLDELTSSIRLDVTPSEAEVYVDGYMAGRVDDFDGIFQRLRVRPGAHELTLYLDGYRTIRQNVYLSVGADRKIRLTMERLPAGDRSEPPPPPSEPPAGGDEPQARSIPFEPSPESEPARTEPATRYGTLSIRVQPADAEILIDGERWSAPADQDRITIQLPEGRHRVEVRKAGFSRYTEDVLIGRGRGLTLNVSLIAGGGSRE